jgi:hypothetical protein
MDTNKYNEMVTERCVSGRAKFIRSAVLNIVLNKREKIPPKKKKKIKKKKKKRMFSN